MASLLAGFLMTGAIVATLFWLVSKPSFSAEDRHFLAAIHDPCSHGEIFDLSAGCSLGESYWKWSDDHTMVEEAHAVCAAESAARVGEKAGAGLALIAARNPNNYDLQTSIEEIAARSVYCPDVLLKP